jgi:hypothetical protein
MSQFKPTAISQALLLTVTPTTYHHHTWLNALKFQRSSMVVKRKHMVSEMSIELVDMLPE